MGGRGAVEPAADQNAEALLQRIGNGGLQNRSFMFVHYKPDYTIETVNY